MRKKTNFLIYPLLLVGVLLLITGGCKKDNDENNEVNGNGVNLDRFTDPRDDNVYRTVTIGSQVWMAENLRYLPSVTGPGTGSTTTPYYYVYDYDGTNVTSAKATANYTTYGVLYNWAAAMAGSSSSTSNPSGVQGVCPTGWHLPSEAEWTKLTDYLGGANIAGGKLKETDTTHWASPNIAATNETDFTALPGGMRYLNGNFYGIGDHTYWWSTNSIDFIFTSYARRVSYNNSNLYSSTYSMELGFYVRCVKD